MLSLLHLLFTKIKDILYEFIDSKNKKEWPLKTDVFCGWCIHPFNNIPCAIPEKYKNGKFYLYGCFCSFNCSASFIFDKYAHDK